MEITAAGKNVLRGTAQGILLVVVRGTDNALIIVKLPHSVGASAKNKYIFEFSRSEERR